MPSHAHLRIVSGVGLAAVLVGASIVGPALVAAQAPEQPAYLATDALTTRPTADATDALATSPTAEATDALTTWTSADDTDPATLITAAAPAQTTAPPGAPLDASAPATLALDAPAPASPALAPVVPAPTVAPLGRVAAIGDSVMLGAAPALQQTFDDIHIDAAVGRQVQAGLGLLRAERAAGALPAVVVIHLGNNGTFTHDQADALLDVLADARRVVFVNLRVPRAWETTNNAVIADAVQRSGNAVLVDWHAASAGRPELFWDDGMHLRPLGATRYASLIATAL